MNLGVLTFGAINTLKSVDAVAFAEIAGSASGAVVWTSCADTFSFAHNQCDSVREQFIIVDGQKPAASIEIL